MILKKCCVSPFILCSRSIDFYYSVVGWRASWPDLLTNVFLEPITKSCASHSFDTCVVAFNCAATAIFHAADRRLAYHSSNGRGPTCPTGRAGPPPDVAVIDRDRSGEPEPRFRRHPCTLLPLACRSRRKGNGPCRFLGPNLRAALSLGQRCGRENRRRRNPADITLSVMCGRVQGWKSSIQPSASRSRDQELKHSRGMSRVCGDKGGHGWTWKGGKKIGRNKTAPLL